MTQAPQEQAIVAIYDAHAGAELAVRALQAAGLDMKRLSIIGQDFQTEEHAVGFYTTGDRIMVWGGRGAFWGSLWGMLLGGAFFFLPGVGPLVVMGPLAAALIGALEGAAVGGATAALAAAFAGIGLPEDTVVKYELEVKAGKFLVLARGTDEMITHARVVLGTTGALVISEHAMRREAFAREARRADYQARDSILQLLSDDENARVASAEASPRLAEGDEYLDLERLERGVQQARGPIMVMERVLPRKAVQEATWGRILAELEPPASITQRMGV
jgi:hypothetical protein